MEYKASYYKDGLYMKRFPNLEDLEIYNKENNIKNHNLHQEFLLSEIIEDNLIVCIEGDNDLEDIDLSKHLKKLPNFLMLNNIYEHPEKLLSLKDKQVDILVIQSTGLRIKAIKEMQKWYISLGLPFPKKIISVLGNEDEFLEELIEKAPFDIEIFNNPDVFNNDVLLERWIGAN